MSASLPTAKPLSLLLDGPPLLGGGSVAMLIEDSLDAVLQAWVLGEQIRSQARIRLYCAAQFHAYFEQADWVQACGDVSGLFQARSNWLGQTRMQATKLAAEGVNHLITIGQGPWAQAELWPALGQGLDSAWAYSVELAGLTHPLRALWPSVRTMAAGPLGLAGPTHHYRSLNPQSLKLVVVLSAERWLQEPAASETGVVQDWLVTQTAIAQRLKLSVAVTRLCLNPGQRLQSRALTDRHPALLLLTPAELLGHVSYADAVFSDLPELTRLAECMGKSSPTLL